jgi:hypothetical protein
MNAQLLHVGESRLTNEQVSTGAGDLHYFGDFQNAWEAMMKSLKPQHREIFRDEIDFRLSAAEFTFCGTLGKDSLL